MSIHVVRDLVDRFDEVLVDFAALADRLGPATDHDG